jgi:hypothetical protein
MNSYFSTNCLSSRNNGLSIHPSNRIGIDPILAHQGYTSQKQRSITMKNLMASLRKLRFTRSIVAISVAVLLLATQISPAYAKEPIGERIGDQLHQTSVNSERPKTTGEFKAEADGDVPLDRRLKNITRDSKEAFGQFGQGITTSVKETGRELGDNIKQAGKARS